MALEQNAVCTFWSLFPRLPTVMMHVDTWCCKLITYGPVSNTCIAVYKPGYMKVCFTAYGNREHLGQPSQPYHPVVRFSGLSEETLNRDPISI